MAQADNSVRFPRQKVVTHNPARFPGVPAREDTRASRARTQGMTVQAKTDDGIATGVYTVESESGSTYEVDMNEGECTGPDSSIYGNTCKHQRRVALEIQYGGLAAPGEQVFEFGVNDVVVVDWSEGEGPKDTVIGVVTNISESGEDTIISVTDYDSDEFELGKTYDCAPGWVEPIEKAREKTESEEADNTDEKVPPGKQCTMCDQRAENPQEHGALCSDCKPD
jgi:hypothetical protein